MSEVNEGLILDSSWEHFYSKQNIRGVLALDDKAFLYLIASRKITLNNVTSRKKGFNFKCGNKPLSVAEHSTNHDLNKLITRITRFHNSDTPMNVICLDPDNDLFYSIENMTMISYFIKYKNECTPLIIDKILELLSKHKVTTISQLYIVMNKEKSLRVSQILSAINTEMNKG